MSATITRLYGEDSTQYSQAEAEARVREGMIAAYQAMLPQLAAEIKAAWLVMHKARRFAKAASYGFLSTTGVLQREAVMREQHLRSLLKIRSAPRRARKERDE